MNKYRKIIERDGTLFELYDNDLQPYRSLWYLADEGMLWTANILVLLKGR